MPNQLPYWLALLHLPQMHPNKMTRLLAAFDTVSDLFSAPANMLQAAGLSAAQISAVQAPCWHQVESDLRWAEAAGHHIVTLADAAYPVLLKEIPDPPPVLFVLGDASLLSRPQLAMVGSRHATSGGVRLAESFASTLAQAGYVITSGLALGIDGASHRGALAVGGETIAVLGTGLKNVYPPAHHSLSDQIISKNGALISEYPLAMPGYPGNFPQRNRTIAGLSLGVLVVEAAMKSGSLITARFAMEQGREVFAIPGSVHVPVARGCHHLIRQGAKLVETAQDVIEETGALKQVCLRLPEPVSPVTLSGKNRLIYDHMDYEITPVDVILLRSQLTAGEVSSILLLLELDGYIQSVPGGYIRSGANQ